MSANDVGTFASFVFVTRAMFSSATGAPYSFLIAVPYENAFSAYAGNCFSVACDGNSGTTEPLAASSPIQSCAPTITSGAVSAWTVLRSSRIGPSSFCTTVTLTPLLCAQTLAIFVTAGRPVLVGPDDDRGRRLRRARRRERRPRPPRARRLRAPARPAASECSASDSSLRVRRTSRRENCFNW